MSMPPPRFIVIPAGAVIKYLSPPGSPPTVIIGASIADIQSLGFTLSEATNIYNSGADFDPGTGSSAPNMLITNQAIAKSTVGYAIKSRTAGGPTSAVMKPVGLVHDTCYWLEKVGKKRSATKHRAKKHKTKRKAKKTR